MAMVEKLFLEALQAALKGERVAWEQEISGEDWGKLFELATCHRVLPMIYDAAAACPAAKRMEPGLFAPIKRTAYQHIMLQTQKTEEFLALYRHLTDAGVTPVLVKGLVCRELYPNPDYRISGDEDLLAGPENFAACHEAMLAWGMYVSDSGADLESDYEVPYRKAGSPLYIELHRHLFPPESRSYGDLNAFFEGSWLKTVGISVNGTCITTLAPEDHLFYLICHAYKHFIHSGFGVRQLCDIALFAKHYSPEIDWDRVYERCVRIRAEHFVAAILKIARTQLAVELDTDRWPEPWRVSAIDEAHLLADVLAAGVYGKSSQSRVHSSNMTLDAVADTKNGTAPKSSLRSSLFPGRSYLEKRYPYLKKYPVLLPVAWVSRILSYGKQSLRSGSGAVEALNVGKDRVELLKRYRIIP